MGVQEMVSRMHRSGLRSVHRLAAAVRSAVPIPEGTQHYLKLNRLLKEKSRQQKLYDLLCEEENTNKPDHELQEIRDEREWAMFQMRAIDHNISQLHSRSLVEQANKYDVEVPKNKFEDETDGGKSDDDGNWEWSHYLETWMLTARARDELKSAIRKERKERREPVTALTGVLLALAGGIGALTGLVLALHK
jgi:hypothetical protein